MLWQAEAPSPQADWACIGEELNVNCDPLILILIELGIQ
jgi:hypothetical protein